MLDLQIGLQFYSQKERLKISKWVHDLEQEVLQEHEQSRV